VFPLNVMTGPTLFVTLPSTMFVPESDLNVLPLALFEKPVPLFVAVERATRIDAPAPPPLPKPEPLLLATQLSQFNSLVAPAMALTTKAVPPPFAATVLLTVTREPEVARTPVWLPSSRHPSIEARAVPPEGA
jgi:hypothetical protein